MSTRITNQMVSRSVLSDLQDVNARLARTQQKLSSGKELTRPSDDPFASNRALTMREELEGVQQYKRNVDDATSWGTVTDTALSRINDVAQHARELLVQGSTDSAGQPARDAIADEIDQLIASAKQEANAQYGGRYVLSGTKTDQAPYSVTGADTFLGTAAPAGAVAREIGPGVSLQINVIGKDVLGDGVSGDGGLLGVLRDISTHLRGGTTADGQALRGSDLKALTASLDTITSTRATVGAVANRLETASSRLDQMEEATTQFLSDVEDADMAKTIMDFSLQQSVYQSALKSGANIVQASLLDFLR
jgi:flagellar hook-associated protein 3 FlgL